MIFITLFFLLLGGYQLVLALNWKQSSKHLPTGVSWAPSNHSVPYLIKVATVQEDFFKSFEEKYYAILMWCVQIVAHFKTKEFGKEEMKLSLFADDMIVYMENPINSIKKLLNLINEFGKTAGYKVNNQKSEAFLYTDNETAETEIRGKMPFVIASRKIKYLGINLTKEVKTCTQKTMQH